MKAILDTNIYDRLDGDSVARTLARRLVVAGKLTAVVPRTIAEELWKSPFGGIPGFFPTEYAGNTVGRCGIIRAGDSMGSGQVFDAHLGKSRKVNDALIADAANWKADCLVSEDRRLLKRLAELNVRCRSMTYDEFKAWLVAAGTDNMPIQTDRPSAGRRSARR
jgi:predicted nucleic acid-binding protein